MAEMPKIFEVLNRTREDSISWKGEENKFFTVRSAFSKLTGPYQVMNGPGSPSENQMPLTKDLFHLAGCMKGFPKP